MSDYRSGEPIREKRRSGGATIAIVLVVIAVIVGLLFATGFWSANVTKDGALPQVSVKGGALPKVDMDSKEVVVGTSKTKVEVPKAETETKTIDVPTVGVKDNGEK
jgi:beta-lactam-binding protein with PASTA domain